MKNNDRFFGFAPEFHFLLRAFFPNFLHGIQFVLGPETNKKKQIVAKATIDSEPFGFFGRLADTFSALLLAECNQFGSLPN